MMSEPQSTPCRRSPFPLQHNKCAYQFQCQRTLYVGPHAHGIHARSPVASSISTNGDLQRTPSGVLEGTNLSAQLSCPFCGNPCKDCGLVGHTCQPGVTSSPPDKDFQGIQWQTPKGMDLGGPGPSRLQGVAQTRAGTGQRVAAQMGTPICPQQPGPGQNCSDPSIKKR